MLRGLLAGMAFCCSGGAITGQTWDELQQLNLHIVQIETEKEEEPTCDYVASPEGYLGEGITNATKVPGRIRIWEGKSLLFDSGNYSAGQSGMKIHVRGNTSAYGDKKPYKIKLEKKADLFSGGAEGADRDWLLLRNTSNLFTQTGYTASRLVGMLWTPRWQYVNLILNGRYCGLYMLMESVKRNSEVRLDIKKTGCIVEYDAYHWNEAFSISSIFTAQYFGWTLKYPKYEDASVQDIALIEICIRRFEDCIKNLDYETIIDMDSFAKWVMVHDILGTFDQGGANEYFMVQDISNPESKWYMPVLWDFDSILRTQDRWSRCHQCSTSYFFNSLFDLSNPAFTKQYVKLWQHLKESHTIDSLKMQLMQYAKTEEAKELDVSRALDANLYKYQPRRVNNDVQNTIEWLTAREQWLDEAIEVLAESIDGSTHIKITDGTQYVQQRKKILRNGQILIKHGNYVYTLSGQRKK